MNKYKLQKGYSLIELLVYIALFAVISVVLVNSLITITKTYATAQGYRRLQSNGDLVIDRMVREIRDSKNISAATYDTNPGSLSLNSFDSLGNPKTVRFSVVGGAIQIDDNGVVGNITTPEVIVSSLVFKKITTTSSDAVKIELNLVTANGYIVSTPFYATAIIRK